MNETLKKQFLEEGYVIIDVLSNQEVKRLRSSLDEILNPTLEAKENSTIVNSSFQHLGDKIEDFGREAKNYYFNIVSIIGAESIHHTYYHPILIKAVEELLGPDIILDNAAIFAANIGTSYSLGWHRDIIQIPQDKIEDWLFNRFHNSVQVNMPLYEESVLWIVPGSHKRPNTSEENIAFVGSKYYAPLGAEMSGGIPVKIKAGQAALYNNNLIHRGHTEVMENLRRTIHMGYHSAVHPPTWHFYGINTELLNDQYLNTLSYPMRQMMEKHLACRSEFPNIETTWTKD
jgi:ectoine hydroxylase-related dioxygenase (phytanoyl-CoA dioxygenase family)